MRKKGANMLQEIKKEGKAMEVIELAEAARRGCETAHGRGGTPQPVHGSCVSRALREVSALFRAAPERARSFTWQCFPHESPSIQR